jgi:hypothetical protein
MTSLSAHEILEEFEAAGVPIWWGSRHQCLQTEHHSTIPRRLRELLAGRSLEIGRLVRTHGFRRGLFYRMAFGYWARPWHIVVIRTAYFETACAAQLQDQSGNGLTRELPADAAPLCRRCVAAIVRREIDRDASLARIREPR